MLTVSDGDQNESNRIPLLYEVRRLGVLAGKIAVAADAPRFGGEDSLRIKVPSVGGARKILRLCSGSLGSPCGDLKVREGVRGGRLNEGRTLNPHKLAFA